MGEPYPPVIDNVTTPDRPAPQSAIELTWVGHASVLLDIGGFRVLTDPVLTRRVAHLRRRRAVPADEVRDVDLVLLSHAHMDHLHLPSLRLVRPGARFVTAVGSGRLLRAAGFDQVTEIHVGEHVRIGPVGIDAVPANHKPGRGPHSRIEAPPLGFVIDTGSHRVYFAGDTDLFDEMAGLGDIDVALLPIWGWGSSIGSGHLDPDRAAHAVGLIRPRRVVPMHWGTYAPEDGRRRIPHWFDDPAERFADVLGRRDDGGRLAFLEPGSSLSLSPRRGPRA